MIVPSIQGGVAEMISAMPSLILNRSGEAADTRMLWQGQIKNIELK